MHFWLAIIAIVAILSFARNRHGRAAVLPRFDADRGETSDRAALVQEISALNGRIAVLERIITENRSSQSLAHEIEALR